MKNLKVIFAAMMIALFSVLGSNTAQAQITTGDQVLAAAGNLLAVQVGTVVVNVEDITLEDVIDVDIDNVLNNNDIRVLNGILLDLEIDNVLNNLLRDANLLTGNQVVIGILSNGTILVADADELITKAKKTKK